MIVRGIRRPRPLTLVATQLGDSAMGFDLEGNSGSFRVSNSGWPEVLAIAEKYGWKPAGTNPPKGIKKSEWDGGYHTMDGQLVTARDASALASAIDSALNDNFQRVSIERTPPATDSERQKALEKLAAVASGMTVEYVKPGKKPAPNRNGGRSPSRQKSTALWKSWSRRKAYRLRN